MIQCIEYHLIMQEFQSFLILEIWMNGKISWWKTWNLFPNRWFSWV